MKDAEVQDGEFRCSMCGEFFSFSDNWTNEEAMDEAKQNGFDLTECLIVCDDCYKLTIWI
jgi:Fe2+ or Zn2+ uptake regulation protein